MKYPKDFINKIICGDCLEVMKEMPDECVDLLITDPPYNLGKNYGKYSSDRLPEKKYWRWIYSIFKECFRLMKIGSYGYVSHHDRGIFKFKPLLEKAGFEFRQLLIWYARNGYGIKLKFGWAYRFEPILMISKGEPSARLESNKEKVLWYTSVLEFPRPQSNFKEGRFHPTQKPIKLYQAILSRTPGDIIFDPFLGSGTTIRAAKDHKRNFIGIEINPDYCKIAEDRLAQGVL